MHMDYNDTLAEVCGFDDPSEASRETREMTVAQFKHISSVAAAEEKRRATEAANLKRRKTWSVNEAAGKHKPRERKPRDFSRAFGGYR